MQIDQNAPLTARKGAFIAAPPERVWAVQTDIARWPEWQADISSAQLEGALAVGTTFRWKAKGLTIISTVEELEPDRRIGWTGKSLGMKAVHLWTFEPQDGGTRVVTEESLAGWFPSLLKMLAPAFLESSLVASLQALKSRAEQP